MKKRLLTILCISVLLVIGGCQSATIDKERVSDESEISQEESVESMTPFYFPDEHSEHEGTWLQWPHDYEYGEDTQHILEPIWIKMTKSLSLGENIHIVAYNNYEKEHIEELLMEVNVDMDKVDFYIHKTEDVWARDNGPFFVKDDKGQLKILDFDFNGWGEKARYSNDRKLPERISQDIDVEFINVHELVLEPGALEFDGKGTMMSTRSAVMNVNRNPGLTEAEIEKIFRDYLGIKQFIWLDAVSGMDITDFHIDGFMKFHENNTIVTMDESDLLEFGVPEHDIKTLFDAKDVNGESYEFVYLPQTANNVVLDSGRDIGYKGSYVNYYIANAVVLVPFYNDPNDEVAAKILQDLYSDRKVVGIDVRDLYVNGGMIHCVTQQQPIGTN